MTDLLVAIRYAKPADAAGLAAVHDAAWREAYRGIIPGVALEAMIARRGQAWWAAAVRCGRPVAVLDIGRRVAGYASYGRCRDRTIPADGEVDELYLSPDCQGLGFGRRLFRAVRNDLAARGKGRVAVWALADNERAIAFYEGLGGRRVADAVERFKGTPVRKVALLFD